MASSGEVADCDQLNTPRLTIGLGRNQGGLEKNITIDSFLRLSHKKSEASHFAAQPTVMSFSSHSSVFTSGSLVFSFSCVLCIKKKKKKDNSVPRYTVIHKIV